MTIREQIDDSGQGERFDPGRIVVTPRATETLAWSVISQAVERHTRGDWGEVWKDREQENEEALRRRGGRIFSIYSSSGAVKFCVISDTRRQITTVKLADEV